MMKRIIGSLLMMVTVVASLSMFVSCKDYDDDINDLRNQISSTSSDLTSLVNDKVNTVESEISSLQSQLSSLESAYKAADENLQKAIDDALENAKKYADDSAAVAEQAAKDYADIQAAQAQEAAIAAAKELIEEAVAELQSQLDAANKTLEEYGTSILGLIEADAQLQVGIDEAVALANAAQEAAETAQAAAEAAQDTANQALAAAQAAQQAADNAQSAADAAQSTADANSKSIEELQETVKGLQDEIDALKQVDADLQSSINSLQSQINVLNSQVEAVVSQAAENKANIEKVYLYLKGLSDANAEAIEELNGKYTALEKLVNDNQEAIEKELKEAVEQLEGEIASALAQAEAYALAVAYQAAGDLYDELLDGEFADIYGQLADINTEIGDLQIAISDVEEAYKEAIEEVYKYVDEADALLQGQIDDLNAAIEELKNSIEDLDVDKLAGRVTSLEQQISELEAEVEGIQAAIEALQEYTNGLDAAIVSLQNVVSGQAKQIDVIFEELANINKYLGVLGKRLTSLVFAPTTYVDGIEAIKFSTLSYTAWDPEKLQADGPDEDGTVYSINNNMHWEEYLVSPSHLDINSIASLSYVCNDAQNISTRSVSDEAPVEVADYKYAENKEGVKTLQIQLAKTNADDDFSTISNEFPIVALKATIAPEYLLDSEIEEGEEVAVYSDWARLYEEHVTPYIHNAIEGEGVDANGTIDEENDLSHFFSWTEIHTSASGHDTDRGTADNPMGSHIRAYSVMSVEYTKTVDLNELVLVCDKNGNTYDIDTYGFEYQFNLFDYYYSEGTARNPEAEISEADYFGIQEGGILYALPAATEEGSASRLAIGKYAPVQAILVDKNNVDASGNPAIVDVRYFLIYFTDAEAFYDMDQLYADSVKYDCGDSYEITILADSIAARCETEDLPITYEELLASYGLKTPGLYKSHEDAKTVGTTDEDGNSTEADPDESLGEIALADDGSGNIIWTITPEVTQEDYDAGEKVINAWGVYQSTTLESNIIPFKLTMTITLQEMTRIAGHNEPYWAVTSGENTGSTNETDSVRIMSPALDTDKLYGSETYFTTQMLGDLLIGYMMDGEIPTSWASMVNSCNEAHVGFDLRYFDTICANTGTDPDDWTTSSTDMSLYYKGNLVAQILRDSSTGAINIILEETNPGQEDSVPVEGAELLVGQYIPLVFYARTCDWYQVLDQYYVYFMEPLTMEEGQRIYIDLYDVTSGGSKSGNQLNGTIELWEEYTTNKRIVYDNRTTGSKTDENLVAWYGVKTPVYDVDNALTNVTTSGTIVTGEPLEVCTTPLSSITNNGKQVYRISYDPETNQFVFENNSQSDLANDIYIVVPVTIQTKWQCFDDMKVIITVHPRWDYQGE